MRNFKKAQRGGGYCTPGIVKREGDISRKEEGVEGRKKGRKRAALLVYFLPSFSPVPVTIL